MVTTFAPAGNPITADVITADVTVFFKVRQYSMHVCVRALCWFGAELPGYIVYLIVHTCTGCRRLRF